VTYYSQCTLFNVGGRLERLGGANPPRKEEFFASVADVAATLARLIIDAGKLYIWTFLHSFSLPLSGRKNQIGSATPIVVCGGDGCLFHLFFLLRRRRRDVSCKKKDRRGGKKVVVRLLLR